MLVVNDQVGDGCTKRAVTPSGHSFAPLGRHGYLQRVGASLSFAGHVRFMYNSTAGSLLLAYSRVSVSILIMYIRGLFIAKLWRLGHSESLYFVS